MQSKEKDLGCCGEVTVFRRRTQAQSEEDTQKWCRTGTGNSEEENSSGCLSSVAVGTHMGVHCVLLNLYITDSLLLVFHCKLFKSELLLLSLCVDNFQLLYGNVFISSSRSK